MFCPAPDPTIALETASLQPFLAKYARILLGSGDRVASAESGEEGLDQQHLPRRSSQGSALTLWLAGVMSALTSLQDVFFSFPAPRSSRSQEGLVRNIILLCFSDQIRFRLINQLKGENYIIKSQQVLSSGVLFFLINLD